MNRPGCFGFVSNIAYSMGGAKVNTFEFLFGGEIVEGLSIGVTEPVRTLGTAYWFDTDFGEYGNLSDV